MSSIDCYGKEEEDGKARANKEVSLCEAEDVAGCRHGTATVTCLGMQWMTKHSHCVFQTKRDFLVVRADQHTKNTTTPNFYILTKTLLNI